MCNFKINNHCMNIWLNTQLLTELWSFENGMSETRKLIVAVYLWSSEQQTSLRGFYGYFHAVTDMNLSQPQLLSSIKEETIKFLHPPFKPTGGVWYSKDGGALNHLVFAFFLESRGGCTVKSLWVDWPVSSTLFKPRVRSYNMSYSHPGPQRPADM